jgi:hypothetical protein
VTVPATHVLSNNTGCLGRIRKVCELDGWPVAEHDVGRGYEISLGQEAWREAEHTDLVQLSSGVADVIRTPQVWCRR